MIFILSSVIALLLSGCEISFSEGFGGKKAEEVSAVPEGAVLAGDEAKIEMGDITISLPEGMKCGVKETDNGKSYYVWNTDAEYVFPTDINILFYAYCGNDINSPDGELTEQEARISIKQTYAEQFRSEVEAKPLLVDPMTTSNDDWIILQFTGYGGDYMQTSYSTMCYPKYYYGLYTLQKSTSEFNRNYYGFVFSNDGTGQVFTEKDYNSIYNQIRNAFSITEFYSIPQNPTAYDAMKDVSNGYSYIQFLDLFADTQNYYGMSAQKLTEEEKRGLKGLYNVVGITDGDTITVNDGTQDICVRLIGVDTPESVSPDEEKNTEEGKEASKWTTNLLENKKVWLEYDMELVDDYGRTLAYVYLEDGVTMVNKELLSNGIARVMTIEPNIKYAPEFKEVEAAAKKEKMGFWGDGFFEEQESQSEPQ